MGYAASSLWLSFFLGNPLMYSAWITPRSIVYLGRLKSSAVKMSEFSRTYARNLEDVNKRIVECASRSGRNIEDIKLIAVSKTKSVEDILEVYNAGHRYFGENYAQELVEKAAKLPSDIKWHFIGHLQSTKAKQIVKNVPNLVAIETVDSIKLANKIQNALASLDTPHTVDVYIQVNTSGEDTKSGIEASEMPELILHLRNECPLLVFRGLMTIGAPNDVTCFDRLVEYRQQAAAMAGVDQLSLGLSMGMSGDFEQAIEHGATSIRVGSTIFGARDYSK